jgi:RNA recognition motif-containing protein
MAEGAPAEVPGTKLFIGNLSWETNVSSLEELFSKYGVVREARVAGNYFVHT